MIDLLPLERDVFFKLLDGDHPILARLRKQFERAVVVQREFTGVGFYTDLTVDKALTLPGEPNFVIGDVDAVIPGVSHGAGFVLFIKEGLLSMLEGYTYDEAWPDKISEFTLHYFKGGKPSIERDFEALKKKLPSL